MLRSRRKRHYKDIDPDEIFLDSKNLPQFDVNQFEGQIEKPIKKSTIWFLAVFFLLVGIAFTTKVWVLQVYKGEAYAEKSENNRLEKTIIFAERGIIYDRNKIALAWNDPNPVGEYFLRKYIEKSGFANLLGYVKYPQKDKSGYYFSEEYIGHVGIEKYYGTQLTGVNGEKITETDVQGKVHSESTLRPPQHGKDLILSVDSGVQTQLFEQIKGLSDRVGFKGGAGVIMNVHNGEILAMTSYPEFDSNIMTAGVEKDKIASYLMRADHPMINRVTEGLYTPGSIVKPYMAIAALSEKIISPDKQMFTQGYLTITSPYDPSIKYTFKDWKNHGTVDMRRAIAVSSDVYFYQVGGGFGDQKGMGIYNIDKYMKKFGFEEEPKEEFFSGKVGTIPDPEWKAKNFNGDQWRIGDTYTSAIGQYGWLVTPIQAVRAVSSIANNGNILKPTIFVNGNGENDADAIDRKVDIPQEYFQIVREGMWNGVHTDYGSAKVLNTPNVSVCAKTGTAELGVKKDRVNSWVTGFFPCENPKYAFAILMENGDVHNLVGATFVMRGVLDWMAVNAPEYLK